MSENILIGKNRKTGKWELLCDPSESYDTHNRVYRKFSTTLPVNDDYSKVIFGRIQNTNTPLTLITSDEKSKRDEALKSVTDKAVNAGRDADDRQKRMQAQADDMELERRRQILDEKNAMVNKIRIGSGQEPHAITAAEILEKEFFDKNQSKPVQVIGEPDERAKAIEAKRAAELKAKFDEQTAEQKSAHEAALAEKNALVDNIQRIAGTNPNVTAPEPAEPVKPAKPAPKPAA